MKRVKHSTTSKQQKEWLGFLNTLNYAEGKVCKGFKEAVSYIEEHI